jgi:hypothetical protein
MIRASAAGTIAMRNGRACTRSATETITTRGLSDSRLRGLTASLVLAASACAAFPDRQFARIGDSLALTIAKVTRPPSGTSAQFVFTIANRGLRAVNACLGPSRSVEYRTSRSLGTSFRSLDHPGCKCRSRDQVSHGAQDDEVVGDATARPPRPPTEAGGTRRSSRSGC